MTKRTRPLSPLWIVLYVTLHLLWRQFFPNAMFVILLFSFVALFIVASMARGQSPRLVAEHLVGRWLPQRADWPIAVVFIMAAIFLRVLCDRCFLGVAAPRRLSVAADLVALAPLSEELICRGLFLGILLVRLPRKPWVAVVWSAAIFLGLHSYRGSNVPAVTGVFSLGLLCGAAYATTRCVTLCIVCHALFNAIQWWTAATALPIGLTLPELLWRSAFFICGAAGIGWLLRLFIRRKPPRRFVRPAARGDGGIALG